MEVKGPIKHVVLEMILPTSCANRKQKKPNIVMSRLYVLIIRE